MGRSVVLAFLALAPSLAYAEGGAVKKHYSESVIAAGEKGLCTVELLSRKGGLVMGVNAVDIILHDSAGKDVPGAAVTVTPWMPDRSHGTVEEPIVFDRGGGVYSVENVVLPVTGRWEIAVEFRKGSLGDRAVFDFPDVRAAGSAHSAAMPGKEIPDTSTEVRSAEGLFLVSYASGVEPVPLNRLHRWTLSVRGSDGAPVTGAVITVVGDMPEHGHGLPTRPEVTEEPEGGEYLLDGLRFSMPGWWAVTFHISAGGRSDDATFNLLVK